MFKIVTIPFDPAIEGFDEGLLNRVTLNKHVRASRAAFFRHGERFYWSVFLEYTPVLEPSSKKETAGLDEPQRILLDRLKAWRRERAETDGVPVFIVGTNREFRDIARAAPRSLEALGQIKGFGKGKVGKYGKEIVEIVRGFYDKA